MKLLKPLIFPDDTVQITANPGAGLPPVSQPYGYLEAPQWGKDFNNGVNRPLPSANAVLVTRSDVLFPTTLSKVHYCLIAEIAGANVGVAIYNMAGNRLTHFAGAGNGGAFPEQTLAVIVTLTTGSYWIAFTGDNTGNVWQCGQFPGNAALISSNGGSPLIYTAANPSVGGVPPGTLGALTGRVNDSKFPYIKFF